MSFARYVAQLDITPGLAYAPFWTAFIQVLRNSMEHEARQVRGPSTESTHPTIRVSTSVTSDTFTVVVESETPVADWEASEVPGSGAGWAEVRNACKALGGSVGMESRDGEGIRISFAFPAQATASARHTPVPRRIGKRGTSAA